MTSLGIEWRIVGVFFAVDEDGVGLKGCEVEDFVEEFLGETEERGVLRHLVM